MVGVYLGLAKQSVLTHFPYLKKKEKFQLLSAEDGHTHSLTTTTGADQNAWC